jgi:hypothetical protein
MEIVSAVEGGLNREMGRQPNQIGRPVEAVDGWTKAEERAGKGEEVEEEEEEAR